MAVEKIGVIGAGQMGTGISHVLSLAGYEVMLDDVNKEALAAALDRIERNMQRQAAKGMIGEDQIKPALARIRTTQSLDDLRDQDLVIEAATEDEAIKKKIFQDLSARLNDKAMIATNTSSISVTRLAAATDRPVFAMRSSLTGTSIGAALLTALDTAAPATAGEPVQPRAGLAQAMVRYAAKWRAAVGE